MLREALTKAERALFSGEPWVPEIVRMAIDAVLTADAGKLTADVLRAAREWVAVAISKASRLAVREREVEHAVVERSREARERAQRDC